MFEKLDLDNHENGSADRYDARPRHYFWWFVHNCVAHPLIGVIPIRPFFSLHDWTSRKINAQADFTEVSSADLRAAVDRGNDTAQRLIADNRALRAQLEQAKLRTRAFARAADTEKAEAATLRAAVEHLQSELREEELLSAALRAQLEKASVENGTKASN